MRLPFLEIPEEENQRTIINFLGLNYGTQTREGEFSETLNVSTDKFPYITQEKPRKTKVGMHYDGHYTQGFFSKDVLYVVNSGYLYQYSKEWERTTLNPDRQLLNSKKQIASVGNYILIFPDKYYYNIETKEFKAMEFGVMSNGIRFGKTEDGLSTIERNGAWENFRVGDAVEVSGCISAPENNITAIIRKIDGNKLIFYANTFTEAVEKDFVTVARKVPDLDFICESGNRLWGCHGDTIYASKFGDPLNFNVFDGLSSDSYYIQVGSDGEFTGCTPYGSHICFFKENTLHKLYGSRPVNYQIVTSNIFGLQKGCENTLCTVNEVLYYMGTDGIYEYTGGVPERITHSFGLHSYSRGVAESDGRKYYISMKDETGKWGFFTFDIEKGLWLRVGNIEASAMANVDGEVLYMADFAPEGEPGYWGAEWIWSANRGDELNGVHHSPKWSVTFCPFNEIVNERKGYSRLGLRIELEEKAYLIVEVAVDGGNWETVFVTHNERARTINVPIAPNRCDSFQVRLSGEGRCLIKSLVRDFTIGSEV